MKNQYLLLVSIVTTSAAIFAAQENRPWLRSLFQRQRPLEKTTRRPESTTIKYRDLNAQPGLNPYDAEIHAESVLYPQKEIISTPNKMFYKEEKKYYDTEKEPFLISSSEGLVHTSTLKTDPTGKQKLWYSTGSLVNRMGEDPTERLWSPIKKGSQADILHQEMKQWEQNSKLWKQKSIGSQNFLTRLYNWFWGIK